LHFVRIVNYYTIIATQFLAVPSKLALGPP
jgi:hypothetical protein